MNLLILDPFAEDYKRLLEPQFPEITIFIAKDEREADHSIDRVEILFTGKISAELLRKTAKLQWIQAKTTGVDYLINLPSLRKDILITSTRGIHGPQMSEMAILLMLALNRNFSQIVRNQDQRVWERWSGKLLYEKKAGILGMGAIGEEIARKCKAFGMTVYAIDILKRRVETVDYFHGSEELLQVIGEVDYFIIVAPLTHDTRKMIGAEALASMKPTAFLINLARGEIVDEEALIQTLKAGKIAGAALDTFCTEPLPKDHPLWQMKNLIITPHVGGMSDIYVEQALSIFEENLCRFLRGERRNLINRIEW